MADGDREREFADSLDRLTGCPCEEDVRWIARQMAVGSPRCSVEDLRLHLEVDASKAADLSHRLHQFASGRPAIQRVEGCSSDRPNEIVVEYLARGGRIVRLVLDRSSSGRICSIRVERLSSDVADVVITAIHTARLAADEHRGIHSVFDAAYRNADHDYLDDQLDRLDVIGLARHADDIIGFFIAGRRTVDLPVIGSSRVNIAGLACTHPQTRRGGVMYSIASAVFGGLEPPVNVMGTSRVATPATLKAQASLVGMGAWPTEEDPLALYRYPSDTQRAVGAALAEAHGVGFDDEHFVCIGRGRPVGDPVVEVDVAPDYAARFAAVDRSRGDTLLWINWSEPPPSAWFS